jgi:hypothetical protein
MAQFFDVQHANRNVRFHLSLLQNEMIIGSYPVFRKGTKRLFLSFRAVARNLDLPDNEISPSGRNDTTDTIRFNVINLIKNSLPSCRHPGEGRGPELFEKTGFRPAPEWRSRETAS